MQYGHFDDEKKEYVITDPKTPAPWCNYLGSVVFGSIISNNAGGYTFHESGANGRHQRFHPNAVPEDEPGRYLYLIDRETKDYWSASWLPVKKNPDTYRSVCRHGLGYTVIESRYAEIETETVYYVPLDSLYEIWSLQLKNTSSRKRKLSLFSYYEFTNENSERQDSVNIQYSLFISRTYHHDNTIVQSISEHKNLTESRNGKMTHRPLADFRFLTVAGANAAGFDGSREGFIGRFGSYERPAALENGACSGSLNYGGNSCGALQLEVELAPGEHKELVFIVGVGNEETAGTVRRKYEKRAAVADDLEKIRALWENRLSNFHVETPDPDFNRMVNIWNAYQCFLTYSWSRAASYIYVGLRDGLGYRDTVQDIQGIMHLEPDAIETRLASMLAGQKQDGSAVRLIPFHFTPGGEIDASRYPPRSDDALWLFPTVMRYLKESGNTGFLDRMISFADGGEASVYEHLKRALGFPLANLGRHGLVLGLEADWNDCLALMETGESVFVSFQLYQGLSMFMELAEFTHNRADLRWAEMQRNTLSENIQKHAWDGQQFVRAFIDTDNMVIGNADAEEGAVWLNPQSWAVISGAANGTQGQSAMDQAHAKLATEYGLMLCYPAFRKFGLPVMRAIVFLPGLKENASIFSQTQGWAVLAETILGRGDRAFDCYRKINPARMNENAEIRVMEPYVHGQFTHGLDSPHHGRSEVHWLTGTAATVQVAAVEGILGVRPQFDGIVIDPCVPSAWKGFSMERIFRGKKLSVTVINERQVQKGVDHLVVNGETIKGNFIAAEKLHAENKISVTMG